MGELKPINPTKAQIVANPQAAAHDYNTLSNKPQINGVTLSGNQTTEDLGITGGTDDYNELSNKPEFVGFREPYYTDHVTIKDSISTPNFTFTQDENGNYTMSLSRVYGSTIVSNSAPFEIFTLATQEAIFKDYGYLSSPPFDFYTNYSSAPYENGIWHISGTDHLAGAPTTLNHRLINFVNEGERIQIVVTDAQLETLGEEKIFVRVQAQGNTGVWQELTGGSEIVSGVVNQNGTITFYDKDGNPLFTTSGASVIGPQGNSITSAEIINNDLIIHIGVLQPDGTILDTPVNVGRVVGQNGAQGQHGDGYTAAQIDENGDLIMTEVVYTSQESTPMVRQVNLGRVVGADGDDYVLTPQDKNDIANIVLQLLPTTDGVLYGNTSN
jgi:hypothetical protein